MSKTMITCLILLPSILFGCTSSATHTETVEKPVIVEIFACGDNCPGPKETYKKYVYKDVITEPECTKIKGKFNSFTGWGTTYYCEVQ